MKFVRTSVVILVLLVALSALASTFEDDFEDKTMDEKWKIDTGIMGGGPGFGFAVEDDGALILSSQSLFESRGYARAILQEPFAKTGIYIRFSLTMQDISMDSGNVQEFVFYMLENNSFDGKNVSIYTIKHDQMNEHNEINATFYYEISKDKIKLYHEDGSLLSNVKYKDFEDKYVYLGFASYANGGEAYQTFRLEEIWTDDEEEYAGQDEDGPEESIPVQNDTDNNETCDNQGIIGEILPSVNELWPPNHKMIPVAVDISGLIMYNPNAVLNITHVDITEYKKKGKKANIYSENGFEPDYEIGENLSLNLRSERAGKSNGRTYNITVAASDCSGVYSFDAAVFVPHKRPKR